MKKYSSLTTPDELRAKPKRNPHGRNELERQDLATPRWLATALQKMALERFGAYLKSDVCAHPENTVCSWYFTEADDGLSQPWDSQDGWPVFCNPPFAHTAKWLEKADYEWHQLGAPQGMLFLLRGADLQVEWVRKYARAYYIEMLTPRVNYLNWREGRIEKGASFPSMLWWRGVSNTAGLVMHPPGGLTFTWCKLRPPSSDAL